MAGTCPTKLKKVINHGKNWHGWHGREDEVRRVRLYMLVFFLFGGSVAPRETCRFVQASPCAIFEFGWDTKIPGRLADQR